MGKLIPRSQNVGGLGSDWPISSKTVENHARTVFASDATARAYESLAHAFNRVSNSYPSNYTSSLQPGGPLDHLSRLSGFGLGVPPGAVDFTSSPGEGCIYLYTFVPMTASEAVANAAIVFNVDDLVRENVAVHAIYTGPIDAYSHRKPWTPMHSGISIAHTRVSAGTLGCHARSKSGTPVVLSNNHVLADTNKGIFGDPILQPGRHDGSYRHVGDLDDFVLINFSGPNFVDCATAQVDESLVTPEFLYMQATGSAFYRISSVVGSETAGMRVGKSGRTTGLTSGIITAVGVTINVNMGDGQVAQFVDQFAVSGSNGPFSLPGDSGSLIWTWDSERRPVGLLFAGGGGTTFANSLPLVLSALDIELVV